MSPSGGLRRRDSQPHRRIGRSVSGVVVAPCRTIPDVEPVGPVVQTEHLRTECACRAFGGGDGCRSPPQQKNGGGHSCECCSEFPHIDLKSVVQITGGYHPATGTKSVSRSSLGPDFDPSIWPGLLRPRAAVTVLAAAASFTDGVPRSQKSTSYPATLADLCINSCRLAQKLE